MAAALPHPGVKQVCSVVDCSVAVLLAGPRGQNLQCCPGSRTEALDYELESEGFGAFLFTGCNIYELWISLRSCHHMKADLHPPHG